MAIHEVGRCGQTRKNLIGWELKRMEVGTVEVGSFGTRLNLTPPRLMRNGLERVGVESFGRTTNLIQPELRRGETDERLGLDVGNLGKRRIPIP